MYFIEKHDSSRSEISEGLFGRWGGGAVWSGGDAVSALLWPALLWPCCAMLCPAVPHTLEEQAWADPQGSSSTLLREGCHTAPQPKGVCSTLSLLRAANHSPAFLRKNSFSVTFPYFLFIPSRYAELCLSASFLPLLPVFLRRV